jgi:hypothetical protein
LGAGRGNLHYAALDLLWLDGKNFRDRPLRLRRPALERLVPMTSTVLSRVLAVDGGARTSSERLSGWTSKASWRSGYVTRYTPDVVWRKIKNAAYTQMEGRGELFHPKPRNITQYDTVPWERTPLDTLGTTP